MKLLLTLLAFHLRTNIRRPAGMLQAPFLLVMGTILFPLSGEPKAISQFAENIVWVMLLLASLLAQPYLLDGDAEDGALEQMRLAPYGLLPEIGAMLLSFWLCYFLPLLAAFPLALIWLGAESASLTAPILATLYLTPLMFLTSALTQGGEKSPLLRALLILPLYAPVIIFGAGGAVTLLAGLTLIMLPFSVWLGVVALKSPAGS